MTPTPMRLLLLEDNPGDARYRSVFDESRVVKLLIDPAAGRIVEANRAACDYYGFDPARLQAMNIKDINTLTADEVAAPFNLAFADAPPDPIDAANDSSSPAAGAHE